MARNADHAREDAEKAIDDLLENFGVLEYAAPLEAANVFVDDETKSMVEKLVKGPCKAAME